MKVKRVDFLLTFECPSKCQHCSYMAGPERKGYMKLADAEQYLEELVNSQPLESICVHGGEPFLHFELMKGIMRKAKKLGIHRTWAITNGYWAVSKVVAKEKLAELKADGLTCITFSVDGFHQEYISLENVRNGVEAAASLGFDSTCVDSYFLVESDGNNFYDNMTRKALERLGKPDGVEIHKEKVGFEGRGAVELTKYVNPHVEMPDGRCQLPFWIGGDLKNPEGIEIDFEGNVTLCPGICIGKTRTKSLTQILQDYDVSKHPILSIISKKGPAGLLEEAIAKGFNQRRKFIDECNLCYEMRKFLMYYYSQHLAPNSCY